MLILFRKNSNIEIINYYKLLDGRRLLVNIRYNEKVVILVNIYVLNNEKDRVDFFK